MSTITHPILLIMAQRLASTTNKTGAKIRIILDMSESNKLKKCYISQQFCYSYR